VDAFSPPGGPSHEDVEANICRVQAIITVLGALARPEGPDMPPPPESEELEEALVDAERLLHYLRVRICPPSLSLSLVSRCLFLSPCLYVYVSLSLSLSLWGAVGGGGCSLTPSIFLPLRVFSLILCLSMRLSSPVSRFSGLRFRLRSCLCLTLLIFFFAHVRLAWTDILLVLTTVARVPTALPYCYCC
jgi:hypothetical protein